MTNNFKNERGIALLLVMGVIAILSFILFEFTFETKLNKLKIYNSEDRFQARLNAESGLNIALAKLRLYQEGRNMIEKNDSIKSSFPPSDLEEILIEPFIYPIPLSGKASIIQQNALKEFEKNTIFRGELSVSITKISGLLNPNSLRVVDIKKTNNPNTPEVDQAQSPNPDDPENPAPPTNPNQKGDDPNTNKTNKWDAAKNIFIKTLSQTIDEKLKTDEDFHNKHANTSVELLVSELAFYVNDANKVNGQDFAEAKNKFSQKNITPKHAPMANIEELHLLPSWDDALVDLFRERMSVHELTTIPVNEITNADLKIIFPEINDMQVEEFFKYRDGDPDKKIKASKFKSADDFKSVVTGKLNIISEPEYQKRIAELKSAGLLIDTASKLYKVNSKGIFNNANYTLVAIVDLPIKERPKTNANQKAGAGNPNNPVDPNDPGNDQNPPSGSNPNDPNKKEPPLELLQPRVVEIRAE